MKRPTPSSSLQAEQWRRPGEFPPIWTGSLDRCAFFLVVSGFRACALTAPQPGVTAMNGYAFRLLTASARRWFGTARKQARTHRGRRDRRPLCERLEDRCLLTAYTVSF